MSTSPETENALEWYYRVPLKEDRTLLFKMLQCWLFTLAAIAGCCAYVSIRYYEPGIWIEMLKAAGILGGFITVVFIVCYWLTKLFLIAVPMFFRFLKKLLTGGYKKKEPQKKPEVREGAGHIDYRFRLDGEKLHCWGAVETKGGRHIRYRRIRKLKRCKAKHRIEVFVPLDKTTLYVPDESFETVWDFLTAHCPAARIVCEDDTV